MLLKIKVHKKVFWFYYWGSIKLKVEGSLVFSVLWTLNLRKHERVEKSHLFLFCQLHALACCLKAISTSDSSMFTERCRLACGGHGYMQSSNLPPTYSLTTASCTYEGDNTVLLLQTARFVCFTRKFGNKYRVSQETLVQPPKVCGLSTPIPIDWTQMYVPRFLVVLDSVCPV